MNAVLPPCPYAVATGTEAQECTRPEGHRGEHTLRTVHIGGRVPHLAESLRSIAVSLRDIAESMRDAAATARRMRR